MLIITLSIVTPFEHGRHTLPKKNDIQRIKTNSREAYLAGGSVQVSFKPDKEKKTILKKVNKEIQRKKRQLGQVVWRKKITQSSDCNVVCIGASKKLEAIS